MEVSRKNYNLLLKKYKECEKFVIGIEEKKKLALAGLKEKEELLASLVAGRDPDEVVDILEKEVETRMEILRTKLLELENMVVNLKSDRELAENKDFEVDI